MVNRPLADCSASPTRLLAERSWVDVASSVRAPSLLLLALVPEVVRCRSCGQSCGACTITMQWVIHAVTDVARACERRHATDNTPSRCVCRLGRSDCVGGPYCPAWQPVGALYHHYFTRWHRPTLPLALATTAWMPVLRLALRESSRKPPGGWLYSSEVAESRRAGGDLLGVVVEPWLSVSSKTSYTDACV